MSPDPEKLTFGVSVEPTSNSTVTTMPEGQDLRSSPQATHPYMTAKMDKQHPSRPTTSDTMTPSPEHDPANPFSAFYEHPPARRSAEVPRPYQQQPQQLLHPGAAASTRKHAFVTESDVESGLGVPVSAATTQTNLSGMPKVSIEHSKECAMWPSRQTLLQQRKAEKQKRSGRCGGCMAGLTKRQKLLVQVLVALLVVGAAVGVGVGVSRAVGGGVWAGSGQTKQVPQDNDH